MPATPLPPALKKGFHPVKGGTIISQSHGMGSVVQRVCLLGSQVPVPKAA